jgi:hypothetical protein
MEVDLVNGAMWSMGRRGVLEVDGRLEQVGFVMGHGVFLLPAPGFVKEGRVEDATLHVPDEGENGLGLQLEVRVLEEGEGTIPPEYARLMDRWEAYHGRRGTARFMVGVAQAARWLNMVVDGDELTVVNTLRNEAVLLRQLNADREVLRRGIGRQTKLRVFEPTAVGVDQRGVDVRTRTGVVRVAAPDNRQLNDAEAAALVQQLLEAGREVSERA